MQMSSHPSLTTPTPLSRRDTCEMLSLLDMFAFLGPQVKVQWWVRSVVSRRWVHPLMCGFRQYPVGEALQWRPSSPPHPAGHRGMAARDPAPCGAINIRPRTVHPQQASNQIKQLIFSTPLGIHFYSLPSTNKIC